MLQIRSGRMPLLVKGGKYIFGIATVGPQGAFAVPPQAMQEYGFRIGDDFIMEKCLGHPELKGF